MDTDRKEQSWSVSQTRRRVGGRGRKRLSVFAGALLKEWKRMGLPVEGEGMLVAVSGGADSVALVSALDELVRGGRLGVNVTVAHLDHGLREESAKDADWVKALAESFKFEVVLGRAAVRERAAEASDNLEQAARRARYEFLAEAARRCGARVVLTGHTMDDQAETVMLRLMRGSGAEGLGGMEAVRALDESSGHLLARPMLAWARRAETEEYCRERGVEFRADEMNEDERYARVRVRRHLLPLMETFNPRVVEALARTAELLREDARTLRSAAEELLKRASEEVMAKGSAGGASVAGSLSVDILKAAPVSLRRRALRLWLAERRGDNRRLELVHLLGIERLLAGERGGRRAELPDGSFVEVRRGRLQLYAKDSAQKK
jgi:tRNA(Ile)-lysidine synthase